VLVGIVSIIVVAVVGLPTLFQYIGSRRKRIRENRIRDVIIRFGPTTTGDFLFHCPQLSERQRDIALADMWRDGEIRPHADGHGRETWNFTLDRNPGLNRRLR
jgi:hypothetical protein